MKYLSLSMMPLAASILALMAGCVVEPGRVVVRGPVVAPPAVVVAPAPPPPPPVVVAPAPVVVEVPDYYAWDGVEYVGYVGDSCFYLGPGNVWLVCDPIRVRRFHDWERVHVDWRVHLAVRNDRYRTDRFGHSAPRREEHREEQDHRGGRRDQHHDDHH